MNSIGCAHHDKVSLDCNLHAAGKRSHEKPWKRSLIHLRICQEHHLEGYAGYPHLLINFDDIIIRLHKTTGTLCDWESNALKTKEEKIVQFIRLIPQSVSKTSFARVCRKPFFSSSEWDKDYEPNCHLTVCGIHL